MMAVLLVALALLAASAVFATALVAVFYVNRAIGKSYESSAAIIAARALERGPALAEERDVRALQTTFGALTWLRADLLLTHEGLHVIRRTSLGIGQPTLVFARDSKLVLPAVDAVVLTLEAAYAAEGKLVVSGSNRFHRLTLKLDVHDAIEWNARISSAGFESAVARRSPKRGWTLTHVVFLTIALAMLAMFVVGLASSVLANVL